MAVKTAVGEDRTNIAIKLWRTSCYRKGWNRQENDANGSAEFCRDRYDAPAFEQSGLAHCSQQSEQKQVYELRAGDAVRIDVSGLIKLFNNRIIHRWSESRNPAMGRGERAVRATWDDIEYDCALHARLPRGCLIICTA